MPHCQADSKDLQNHILSVKETPKGNLYLHFDIVFPKKIFNEHKKSILAALDANK
jgi:DnaJ-class molecular chaperone